MIWYSYYRKNPSIISEQSLEQVVVIDEVQKLPEIQDEVHRLIELRRPTFLLTGSSTRKLKRGEANLLAGRAWWAELFPLTSIEIPDFDLLTYLNRGGLPAVYPSDDYEEKLTAYTGLYLKEEIQNEALTRKIANFSEFLDLMALSNGSEISYQSFASDCGVSSNTIKNYIQILEDSLIAFQLQAYTKTLKRKGTSRSKLYFFDIGATNSPANRGEIKKGSELFGKAFEHYILLEIRAYLSYFRKRKKLRYWRSTSQFEFDVLVGNCWALEIKSTTSIQNKHLKGIRALKEEGQIEQYGVIRLDRRKRKTKDNISIFPWTIFLEELWNGGII